ncbi:MAG: PucR family transcriptional regulator [Mogibacterium sp.]|nr:PucR family transcriptional regulator [Mogibacterium sp.]
MKISVNDCLKLDSFRDGRLICCENDVGRRVRTVSVLDEADLDMGVERNGVREQMVITHFWISKDDIEAQKNAVTALGNKGISALVIYLNEEGVREVSDEVIRAAEEVSLPIITIKDTGKITYAMLIEEVLDKILYGENYSDNILNNTIYHLLNFEKHSNFPNALREAAIFNNYQVVLMTEEFNPILTVETRHLVKIEDAVSAARKEDAFNMNGFTRVDIEGVITYWGYINIKEQKYILVIVDNEDEYSGAEMTKLAQTIELTIGMWKYTPERDSRAEFIKSAVRGDISFCYTLLDESALRGMQFCSVFCVKHSNEEETKELLEKFKKEYGFGLLTTSETDEIFGIIYTDAGTDKGIEAKNAALRMFDELKSGHKETRIFHITGLETIEAAVDGFKMINRAGRYMEKVFPFKRVFSKYEMSMVSDCVYMTSSAPVLQKMYLDLIEPFEREVSPNKGKLLLETLSTFVLDAGMNSNRTAEFLEIHNNTVQYRLKKANEILGAEMTANRVIPGLTMALALRRLEDN